MYFSLLHISKLLWTSSYISSLVTNCCDSWLTSNHNAIWWKFVHILELQTPHRPQRAYCATILGLYPAYWCAVYTMSCGALCCCLQSCQFHKKAFLVASGLPGGHFGGQCALVIFVSAFLFIVLPQVFLNCKLFCLWTASMISSVFFHSSFCFSLNYSIFLASSFGLCAIWL